ncbi:glycosyltransferase [Methylomarinum vadi]|uniref:glycosyltransferase n=1 Tax=Methylomarinum vadi TaxID=438855 RepID=UPI0004DFBFA4|nr:glycosyltransferase [Methylomarinum vadi]
MHILIVSDQLPMPDRASGDLRFYSLLKSLANRHTLVFFIKAEEYQRNLIGETNYIHYKSLLSSLGIDISTSFQNAVKKYKFECVIFEFYYTANFYLSIIRYYQPESRIFIDSVDVHFNRLYAKAKLSEDDSDYNQAKCTESEELSAYSQADALITVSQEDKDILLSRLPNSNIFVIPNIHHIPDFDPNRISSPVKLLFVGNFKHPPNVDGIIYFCQEIMPLLAQKIEVKLTIVGNSPTDEVRKLANNNIKVTGFVPEVGPYYSNTDIVIAPLRFGGGLKGKVGEAMSYSRPLVMTSFGAEGFSITDRFHYLLANSADEFIKGIVELSNNPVLYDKISLNAWNYINDNYSDKKIDLLIESIFSKIDSIKIRKLTIYKRMYIWLSELARQHLLWRFKR